MSPENYFFILFFVTIIFVRLFLFLKPVASPTIKGIRLHHYMYGIGLIAVSLFLRSQELYAIGFGLFFDEAAYILTKGQTHEDNYSPSSILGTIIFVILVFFLREAFVLLRTF